MQKHWLKQDGNTDLILFILGWGADHHTVEHLALAGCDVLCTYDYRTLEPFTVEELSAYQRIHLFAWSFGVWVAEQVCGALVLAHSVALNGTPYPIDDCFGIPRKSFAVTLRGIGKRGSDTFNQRTYGSDYARLAPYFGCRPFDEKLEELTALFEQTVKPYTPSLWWQCAVVGDRDVIFPPENMLAYWGERAVIRPLPHYPFGDPTLLPGLLSISCDLPAKNTPEPNVNII